LADLWVDPDWSARPRGAPEAYPTWPDYGPVEEEEETLDEILGVDEE